MVTTRAAAGELRIKGVVLASRHSFVVARHGRAAWARLLAGVSAECRALLEPKVRPSAWYPLRYCDEVDIAICGLFAAGDQRIYRIMGQYSADTTAWGGFGAHMDGRDPQGFLRAAQEFAPRFFDPCRLEILPRGDRHVLIRLSGFVSSEPNCESNLGFFTRGLELCGATRVSAKEDRCSRRGAPADEYDIRWEGMGPVPADAPTRPPSPAAPAGTPGRSRR